MNASSDTLVTVAIPTFNRAHFLERAARSVLDQTHRNLELWIYDNASEDDTPAVCARLVDDPRVRIVRHESNIGFVPNQNAAYGGGAGEYILVIGDDDILRPDFLASTVPVLDASPQVGLVHTAFELIGPEEESFGVDDWTYGLTRDTIEDAETFLRQSMEWSCRICSITALLRRAALPEGGMREDDHPAVDFLLWLRMARAGWSFGFVARPLAAYRVHPGSFSAQEYGTAKEGGYVYSFDSVERVRQHKLRFLESLEPARQAPLRPLVDLAVRREIVAAVRKMTLGQPGARWRRLHYLRDLARLDAGALLTPIPWRPLAADVLSSVRRTR